MQINIIFNYYFIDCICNFDIRFFCNFLNIFWFNFGEFKNLLRLRRYFDLGKIDIYSVNGKIFNLYLLYK